jgi:hypothetical protein
MGRKKFRPTEADMALVKNMAAAGIPEDQIADCIGIRGIDKNTLRKYFKRELQTSRNSVTALAMSQVVKAMSNGEAWACCFWLKCRAGWKETDRHEITGAEGRPIEVANASPRQAMIAALEGQPQEVKAAIAQKLLDMATDGDKNRTN